MGVTFGGEAMHFSVQMLLASLIPLLTIFSQVIGHGNMYYPPPWHDVSSDNSYFGPNWEPNALSLENKKRGYRGINYPLPESTCRGRAPKCSAARLYGGANDWFTNYTFISGEPTLPRNMYDDWSSNMRI